MTDRPDIREQLAAYLAGELDGPAADAVQARIDAEPWVADLADQMAELLVELGGVDDIEPPPGFGAALHEGLARELGHDLPPPLHAADAAPHTARVATRSAPVRPTGRRDRGRPGAARAVRVRRALGVVAVLAVLGIASTAVLTGGEDSQTDESGVTAADDGGDAAAFQDTGRLEAEDTVEDAVDDAAVTEEEAAEAEATDRVESAAAAGSDESSGTTALPAPPADDDADVEDEAAGTTDRPAVVDLGAVADDTALLERLGEPPAITRLLGRDARMALELATTYRDQLLAGPSFPDGTPAATCLDEVLEAAGPDHVPAVAARVDLPDGPAVAYALVTARGGEVLDGVDVWVMGMDRCATRRVLRGR